MSENHLALGLVALLDEDALDELAKLLAPRLQRLSGPELVEAPENLLSCAEAAGIANVHPETIRRAARSGKLRCVRAGTAVRVPSDALTEWLRAPKRTTAPPRSRARHRRTGTPLKDALNTTSEASNC